MSDVERSQTGPQGVAFLLAQIGAQGAAKFAERLESLKLSPPQAGIIGLIGKRSGLSQQALANLLGMFPSRLVLMLDELERSGLIERRANADDRRTYSLYLTASGTKILQAIGRIARQHDEAMCAALDEYERETLAGFLSRIAEEQKLKPGVHPGYRRLGGEKKKCQ